MLCFPMLISSLPGANPRLPEHKIEVFVRFWASGPPFWAFRAQNRGFCVRMGGFSGIFGTFEHKIGVFVRGGAVMLVVFGYLSLNCSA